tara:strand:- start:246 stop:509 length:264 start_codon:yes stop_codon:yes gene_type:complete
MPAIVRIGDAHGCGSTDTGGSTTVFANGLGVHRIGDADAHGGTQVGGSTTVFADGIGVARIGDNHSGDPVPHGPSAEASGSPDVFVD